MIHKTPTSGQNRSAFVYGNLLIYKGHSCQFMK